MLNYIEYTTGNEKGDIADDSLIANPWQIGDVTNFTGQAVTQVSTGAAITPAWTPVVEDAFTDTDGTTYDVKVVAADGTVTYVDLASDGTIPAQTAGSTVAYVYNNTVVPQAQLPMLKAEMKSIALLAHARRIAVNMCAA